MKEAATVADAESGAAPGHPVATNDNGMTPVDRSASASASSADKIAV